MKKREICPECAPATSRRSFLKTAGVTAAVVAATGAGGMGSALAALRVPKGGKVAKAEENVLRLYDSLSDEQRKIAALPFDDPRAQRISANWQIIKPNIGEFYSKDQQEIIHEILRGVTSEDGYERILRQMREDNGGFGNYSCAIFGNPHEKKAQWVMTGRHLTVRADGNVVPNRVFGGPLIYGHGSAGNTNANLFYYQTKAANTVFQALDGKQREKALVENAPRENDVAFRNSGYAGINLGELSKDQKELVHGVMHQLLAPYREADVKEALSALKGSGGLDAIHMAFYQTNDIDGDKEWDIWRLESPLMVWHFRGAPHVHAYINFRTKKA